MDYKIVLNATMCDRFTSNFMKACDLGIENVGVPVKISITIENEPTDEIIQKIIAQHLKTKENKSLDKYFDNISLNRIELVRWGE